MRTLRSAHVHDFITSLRLEIPYAMVALEIRYHVVFLQHDDASMRRLAAALLEASDWVSSVKTFADSLRAVHFRSLAVR
jgi:hypothetical protein